MIYSPILSIIRLQCRTHLPAAQPTLQPCKIQCAFTWYLDSAGNGEWHLLSGSSLPRSSSGGEQAASRKKKELGVQKGGSGCSHTHQFLSPLFKIFIPIPFLGHVLLEWKPIGSLKAYMEVSNVLLLFTYLPFVFMLHHHHLHHSLKQHATLWWLEAQSWIASSRRSSNTKMATTASHNSQAAARGSSREGDVRLTMLTLRRIGLPMALDHGEFSPLCYVPEMV